MPHVPESEALNGAFLDWEALADDLGPPPWRACLVGTPSLRVVLLHWSPGTSTVPHVHPWAEEVFLVLRGRACFTVGDEAEREVGPGTFLLAKRGVRHVIRVPSDAGHLLLLAAVAPNEDRPDETIEPA